MNLRSETPADLVAIAKVTRLAFTYNGGVKENEMLAEIRTSGHFVPDLSLVAEQGGEIVGHVSMSPTDLRGDTANMSRPRRVLYLEQMS